MTNLVISYNGAICTLVSGNWARRETGFMKKSVSFREKSHYSGWILAQIPTVPCFVDRIGTNDMVEGWRHIGASKPHLAVLPSIHTWQLRDKPATRNDFDIRVEGSPAATAQGLSQSLKLQGVLYWYELKICFMEWRRKPRRTVLPLPYVPCSSWMWYLRGGLQ